MLVSTSVWNNPEDGGLRPPAGAGTRTFSQKVRAPLRQSGAGRLPAPEDQLAGLIIGGGYQGPGRSPDRADAMAWALTELLLGDPPAEPPIPRF
jgi:phage terminase large subunit-like protein